ncbi:MAG: hypothetical protein AB2754_20850 [Candidatus Thiodiazotropha endolucinida]
MHVYKPRKRRTLQWVAMGLRGLGNLYGLWPVLLIAGLVFSPAGPYLLTDYTYERRGSYRHILDCTYLGLHGRVKKPAHGDACPFVIITDHSEG